MRMLLTRLCLNLCLNLNFNHCKSEEEMTSQRIQCCVYPASNFLMLVQTTVVFGQQHVAEQLTPEEIWPNNT